MGKAFFIFIRVYCCLLFSRCITPLRCLYGSSNSHVHQIRIERARLSFLCIFFVADVHRRFLHALSVADELICLMKSPRCNRLITTFLRTITIMIIVIHDILAGSMCNLMHAKIPTLTATRKLTAILWTMSSEALIMRRQMRVQMQCSLNDCRLIFNKIYVSSSIGLLKNKNCCAPLSSMCWLIWGEVCVHVSCTLSRTFFSNFNPNVTIGSVKKNCEKNIELQLQCV